MKTERRKFGDFGEEIVSKFLVKQGFDVLHRNYLKPWGEIDIVARKGDTTYFVEVKSIRSNFFSHETDEYNPAENVHPAKLKRLTRIIQTYILENDIDDNWKFIVACAYIKSDGKSVKVKILEDIVL